MYCVHCGKENNDRAVACAYCGYQIRENRSKPAAASNNGALSTVVKVFMVISCIARGWAIIPLLWCIPMTVYAFNKLNTDEYIGIGFKICTLLFVNLVAGICLLCMDTEY